MPQLAFLGGFQAGIDASQRRQQLAMQDRQFQQEISLRQQSLAQSMGRDELNRQEFEFKKANIEKSLALDQFKSLATQHLLGGGNASDLLDTGAKFGLKPEEFAAAVSEGYINAQKIKQQEALQNSLMQSRQDRTDLGYGNLDARLTEGEANRKSREDIAAANRASMEKRNNDTLAVRKLLAAGKSGELSPEQMDSYGKQFDSIISGADPKSIDPNFLGAARWDFIVNRGKIHPTSWSQLFKNNDGMSLRAAQAVLSGVDAEIKNLEATKHKQDIGELDLTTEEIASLNQNLEDARQKRKGILGGIEEIYKKATQPKSSPTPSPQPAGGASPASLDAALEPFIK